MTQTLAVHGGTPTKTVPYGTGKRFGAEELEQLRQALEQNTLFYWAGTKVKEFNHRFATRYGMPHCVAASSGTAAIHVALATAGVTVGDEVITTPITDMGSLIGILYQNAVPVFADLDPRTYNLDPQAVERAITPRTKAILVVHLAGNPADMDGILAVARRHGLKVVEDCAQSYLCEYKGKLAGTIGDLGCFSLNDFKHISAGDGGMVLLRDEAQYRTALRFADKNYDRLANDPAGLRRIPYLAPNYRMTELQGAVAIAQLNRLDEICRKRTAYGDALTAGIADLPGILTPRVLDGCRSTYWFYMLRLDERAAKASRNDFAAALKAEGVPCKAGYIPTCVYEYDLFQNLQAHPGSHWPFDVQGRSAPQYGKGLCPVAEEILRTAIAIPVNEFYTTQDLQETIGAFRKVSAWYAAQ